MHRHFDRCYVAHNTLNDKFLTDAFLESSRTKPSMLIKRFQQTKPLGADCRDPRELWSSVQSKIASPLQESAREKRYFLNTLMLHARRKPAR